jgi:mRNA interferase MazF
MSGMTARRGQIVGIPFPYADLQTRKRRPVVVLTEPDRYGDFIAVAVTSVPTAVLAVPITNDDLSDGLLPKPSWVRCDKMFTLSQAIVVSHYGTLGAETLNAVLAVACPHLGCRS